MNQSKDEIIDRMNVDYDGLNPSEYIKKAGLYAIARGLSAYQPEKSYNVKLSMIDNLWVFVCESSPERPEIAWTDLGEEM